MTQLVRTVHRTDNVCLDLWATVSLVYGSHRATVISGVGCYTNSLPFLRIAT